MPSEIDPVRLVCPSQTIIGMGSHDSCIAIWVIDLRRLSIWLKTKLYLAAIAAPISFSRHRNKTFLRRRVSPTNPVVALDAEQLANKLAVATAAAAVVTTSAKCTRLLAPLVAKKPKFLSVRAVTVRFTAAIASVPTAVTRR
jgi:hypothetical protein